MSQGNSDVPEIDVIKRFCPNEKCPDFVATGRPRHIGDSKIGYARHYCKSCRKWWTFREIPLFSQRVAQGEMEI